MNKKTSKIIASLVILTFLLTIPTVFGAETNQTSSIPVGSITTYGEDAENFASSLATKAVQTQVIIVSDLGKADIPNLLDSLKDQTILVAINLPGDNGLTPVPKLTFQSNETILEFNKETNSTSVKSSVLNATKVVNPEYWISVIKCGSPLSAKHFLLMNNSAVAKEQMVALALGAVEQTGLETAKQTSQMTLDSFSEDSYFTTPNVLEYLLYWGPDDELVATQSISQMIYYDDLYNTEFWKVDSHIDSNFLGVYEHRYDDYYFYRYGHIGPYIKSRTNTVDANIGYGEHSGLYDYGPNTTPSDVGIDFTFGVSLNHEGGTIDASVTRSWNNPGVSYLASPDDYLSRISTTETFRDGRDTYWNNWPFWWGWGYIEEPTPNAYGGYATDFVSVMQTSKGSGFDIESLQTSWQMYDDRLWDYGGYLTYDMGDYTWTVTWDPTTFFSIWASEPPYSYVSSVTNSEGYPSGQAAVYNRDGAAGSSPDTDYAHLHAGSSGSLARIWTTLDQQTSGHIAIYGKSDLNCYSHVLIYVSTDNYNWGSAIKELTVYGTSGYWIDAGYTSSQFRYVLIIVYNTSGSSNDFYIDAVRVY